MLEVTILGENIGGSILASVNFFFGCHLIGVDIYLLSMKISIDDGFVNKIR